MIELKIREKIFRGFTGAQIKRGFKSAADGFSLAVVVSPDPKIAAFEVEPGDLVEIYIARTKSAPPTLFLTGRVDREERAASGDSRSIKIEGRSLAGQIIDSAAIHKTGTLKNRRFDQVLAEFLKPFSIPYKIETDLGDRFEKIVVDQGETVFDLLDRLATDRGLILSSLPNGGLLISRALINPAAEILDSKTADLSRSRSIVDRFSKYFARAYKSGGDSETVSVEGTAEDSFISGRGLYRPTVISLDDSRTLKDAKERAQIEANLRAGRSTVVSATVPGWYTKNGTLIEAGQSYRVADPWLDLNEDFFVSEVSYNLDSRSGFSATLTLDRPSAVNPPNKKTDVSKW